MPDQLRAMTEPLRNQQQDGSEPSYGAGETSASQTCTTGEHVSAADQRNRLATAGAIASLIPPLGLVLSIMGLIKCKAVNGAGKIAATAGVVLSLVFASGYGVAIAQTTGSGGSDPVCASAISTLRSLHDTFSADTQKGSWQDSPEALETDVTGFAADIGNARTEIDSLIGKSTHADVKAKLQDMDAVLSQTAAGFSDNDANPFTNMQTLASRTAADGTAISGLCSGTKN